MNVQPVVDFVTENAKFFVALAAAAVVAVALGKDGDVSLEDIVAIVSAFTGAGTVQRVRNRKP